MKRFLQNILLAFGLTVVTGAAFAQAPIISYTTPDAYAVGAMVSLSPTSTGGAVTGGLGPLVNYSAVGTPHGLGFDPTSGKLFAGDYINDYDYSITIPGAVAARIGAATYYNPYSIVADKLGNIYVSDPGDAGLGYPPGVYKVNAAGTVQSEITGFTLPEGTGMDANNYLYVADNTTGNITQVSSTGTKVVLPATFTNPVGVTANAATGDLFVVQANGNLYKVALGTTTGTTETLLETLPTTSTNLYLDASANLYIPDGNANVNEYSSTGVMSTPFTGLSTPYQVTEDASGNLYESDYGTSEIKKATFTNYSISGTLPAGLAFSTSTGIISGTTTAETAATILTITAYNSSGSYSTIVIISVNNAGAPTITYSSTAYTFTQGTAITNVSPATLTGTPTSVTISPAFPTGLSFTTVKSGIITGTPTVYSPTTTYTVIATNANGSNFATFTIKSSAILPVLSYPASPYVFATGAAVTITPTATGGTATSVTTSAALPAGLSISSTGVITGTSSVASTGSYTVTPSNTAGTGSPSNSFVITIAVAPAFSYTTPYQPTEAVVMTPLAPTVTAGSPTSYAETGTLPTGITFSTATGTFSGTPANATSRTVTVTATNAAGLTTTVSVTIKPVAAALFSYANPAAYTVGTAIATLTPTSTYTLSAATVSPALPAGLSLSAAGVITGTPTTAAASAVYTVTAYSSNGYYSTATVTISVVAAPAPALVYSTPNVYNTGSAVTLTPANSGGTPTGCTIASVTPAGVTLASYGLTISATGVISGTPTAALANTSFVVTSTNPGHSTTSNTFFIQINTAPVFSYSGPNTYTVNSMITALSPAITSGAPLTGATISPTLPAGLSISAAGVISGTPTATSTTATTYTITATGSGGGQSTATVVITVNPQAPILTYTSPNNDLVGVAISTLSPGNTGGAVTTVTGYSAPATFGTLAGASEAVTYDPISGAFYAVDYADGYLDKITTAGVVTTINIPTIDNDAGSSIAVDGLENIWVTDAAAGEVDEFSITGGLEKQVALASGAGIAIDASNNVYVVTTTGKIYKIAAGATTATQILTTVTLTTPYGIALSGNNVFISQDGAANNVIEIANGLTGSTTTAVFATGFNTPHNLTFNAAGTLFVANYTGGTVVPLSSTGVAGTTVTSNNPGQVAFDATGNMYIADFTTTVKEAAAQFYAYTGTLPPGLVFNYMNGSITGTPTTAGSYTIVVTASNQGGTSTANSATTGTVVFNVVTPPTITYIPPTQTFAVNTAISPLIPAVTGSPTSYAITGTLPTGLTFSTATGQITGTPTVTMAATNYTISAIGSAATGTTSITISVVTAPVITYTSPNSYVVGTAIASLMPANSGGPVSIASSYAAPVTFSALGNKSAAVTYDPISGAFYAVDYTDHYLDKITTAGVYTTLNTATLSTNAGGSIVVDGLDNIWVTDAVAGKVDEFSITGTLEQQITLASCAGITVDAANNIYVVTTTGGIYKIAAGGTTATQILSTVTLTTPFGIAISGNNVFISQDGGVNNVIEIANGLTGSTTSAVFATGFNTPHNLTFNATGTLFVANYTGGTVVPLSSTGVAGTAVTSNTPGQAAFDPAGNMYIADYTKNIKEAAAQDYAYTGTLPPGLTFNYGTGIITGTPTTAGTYTIVVTAANVAGTSTANAATTSTVIFNCGAAPTITYIPPSDVLPINIAINAIIPAVTGTPAGYAITGTLPAGLSFSTSTGQITGTPTALAAATAYTITATNTYGTATTSLTLSVVTAPVITYTSPDNYTVGTAIASLTPANTGGAVTIPSSFGAPATFSTVGGSAEAITYDPISGAFYAVDYTNGYLDKITTAGVYTDINPTNIDVDAGSGIVVDGLDNIWVTDANADELDEFTINGTLEQQIAMTNGAGLAVDANNNVYVVTTGGKIYEVAAGGTTATQILSTVTLTSPFGIAISGNNLFISQDGTANNVIEIANGLTGSTATTVFASGFNAPQNLTFNSGILYVANYGGGTVVPLSSTGVAGTTVTSGNPGQVAFDPTNNMYVATMTTTIKKAAAQDYAYTGSLPPGLTFNYSTGVVTGTPTLAGTYTIVVTASNIAGTSTANSSTTGTVVFNCAGPPTITYIPVYNTFAVNTAITALTPAVTGTPTSYAISGTLPTGLTFSTSTGVISGTATVTQAQTSYTVTAYNGTGSSTATIYITVLTAPVITYTSPNNYTVGTAIPTLTPSNTGGAVNIATSYAAVTTFSTLGNKSAAVTYDPISNAFYAVDYTDHYLDKITTAGVYATLNTATLSTNGGGSIVVDGSDNIWVTDAIAGKVDEFSITGTLEQQITLASCYGLAVDAANNIYVATSTGAIYKIPASGSTATQILSSVTLTTPYGIAISGNNVFIAQDGTANNVIEIANGLTGSTATTVYASGLNTPHDLTFNAAGNLFVGNFGGGNVIMVTPGGTVTTAVTTGTPGEVTFDPAGNMYIADYTKIIKESVAQFYSYTGTLPPGLTFNYLNGVITGTPTTANTYTIVVTASNIAGTSTANSSTTSTVIFNCVGPPVISYTPATVTYPINVAITALSPAFTGTPTGYVLTGTLPAGLTFTASTGVISGTPTAVGGPTSVTVYATSGAGNSNTVTISITIAQPPVLAYTTPDNYLVGTAIATLSPTNMGGAVTAAKTYPTTGTVILNTATNGLNEPYGLAVDPLGNVYVANYGANTIVEYGTSGTVTTISTGAATGPVGLVFDSSNNAYVLDQTTNSVVKFTYAGGGVISGTPTTIISGLFTPTGIAIDASNNIYVGNSAVNGAGNYTISKYTTAGGAATLTFNTEAVDYPVSGGISVDANGNIWVVDNDGGGYVDEYSATGAYTNETGEGNAATNYALYIDGANNDYLTGATAAYTYTPGFAAAGQTITPPFSSARGVVTDGKGNLYVSDYTAGTVTRFTPISGYFLNGTLPPGLAFSSTTGQITGTPTTTFSGTYTVTAYNSAGGGTSNTFVINCGTKPTFSYATADVYGVSTTNIIPLTPVITGTPITSFAVGTALPAGLTLNTTTGVISGPPNVASAQTSYLITATNSFGTATFTIKIAINPTAVISYTTPNALTQGTSASLPPTVTSGTVGTAGTYQATTVLTSTSVSAPLGMGFDPSGNLYTANYTAGTITEYNTTTGATTTYSLGATSEPVGIVFDSAGDAFIAEKGTNTVVKYTGGMSGTATAGFITGLNAPSGIAIDASGNIYIANSGNNRILKYPATGGATASLTITAKTTYGTYVTGGIAIDSSGNIYVADTDTEGIDVYNPAGVLSIIYDEFTDPYGVSIDNVGNVFVTDYGTNDTYEYTAGFGTLVAVLTGFTKPEGVVADASGYFYVSDYTANTVTKYTLEGGYRMTGTLPRGLSFNTNTGLISGIPQTVFTTPVVVNIDAYSSGGISNSVAVSFTSAANPPIIAYTPSTNIYAIGAAITPLVPAVSGGPEMQATFPTGTALTGATLSKTWGMTKDPSGNIWVVNYGTPSVTEFSGTGTFMATHALTTANPTGVAVDVAGNVDICFAAGAVYQYNATFTTNTEIITPGTGSTASAYGIAVDAAKNVYVSDNTKGWVFKYTASTATFTELLTQASGGGLGSPTGISVDAEGNVYVLDLSAKALLEYSSGGIYEGAVVSSLGTPYGLFVDSKLDYFIADASGSVTSYDDAGTQIYSIVGLTTPRGVAADNTGDIYVSSYTNSTVTKYVPTYYVLTGGALPAGLAFSTATGTFSGTPTAAAGPNTYTISVYGAYGNNSTTVTITCAAAPVFTYTSPQVYTDGVAITPLSPNITGGGPIITATISPALPPGLSIDANGNITGTPTTINGPIQYTVTGTNSYGLSGTDTLTIKCVAPAPIITYGTPWIYTVGTAITPLTPSSTGGAVVSYAAPSLPAGLTIDPTTGIISGTPTAVSVATNYVVTATNSGGSDSFTINITVNDIPPVITYTTPDVYTVNTAITPLTPTSTGGTVVSYSAPTLPAGLSINTTTGVISGTPTTITAATNYLVTATNTGGSNSFTIEITVNDQVPVITYPTPQVYTVGTAIPTLTPTSTGGTVITYSASLPAGLSIVPSTGVITGTPTTVTPATNYVVTATNSGGTGTFTINITVNDAAPIIAYTTPDVFTVGSPIAPLNPTSTGGVVVTYTAPSLPAGLAIDAGTGAISGTPTTVTPATNYVVTATNSGGTTNFTINITVNDQTPVVAYTTPDVYTVGTAITPLTPTSTGGAVVSYAAPSLPAGLTIDPTTGIITGTPTAVSAGANYNVTATNSGGSVIVPINITVNDIAPAITYTTPDVYTVGTAIAALTPTSTGGTVINYSVTILPTGLSINSTTGAITGTPTAITAAANYIVTATNSGGTTNFTINITVNDVAPIIAYTTPYSYDQGSAITPLTPTSTGGAVVTYSTTGLPAGLSIDPVTGIISGTPTTITAAANYVVTATNTGGSVNFTINITITLPAPVIAYTTPDSYDAGTTITPLTPTSTGGAVVSYAAPTLPAGLSIDPVTGIISGTPTTATPAGNYTVTATNAGGTGTFIISIVVNGAAPVIAYTTPDVYTVGSVISPLSPTSTGGAVTGGYTVSPGLPAGLVMDPVTGIITGTPTAATAAANYVVTAANAGGTGMFTINITVQAQGPVFTYTTPDVFPINTAITPLSPVNTGTTPVMYAISPGLPTGLVFNTGTGVITGTPTTISPATTYMVTATDASSNTGTFNISIACGGGIDWIGVTSTDWNDPTNWASGTVPTATDIANIGVNQTFLNFPNLGPATPATNSVATVIIGSSSTQVTTGTSATAQAGGIVVNTGSILNVSGTITYLSDANAGTLTATLSGAGTINAAGVAVTANTTLATPAAYTETMTSSVTSLVLASNATLTSSVDGSGNALNATFNITGGITSIGGEIETTNSTGTTSTISVTNATLQLAGATPLAGLSATGTNTISVLNTGATVEYSGAGQTVYTDLAITGLPGGLSYQNIKFSGTGIKTPNGTTANNLNITGDFTNALTLNDADDYINLTTPIVNFIGATENIYGGNGTGTSFLIVNFSGTGTATIQSGNVYEASLGILTMSNTAQLAAGGFLTLISDVNGAATVAAIPAGCSITGTVNVQRYLTGGSLPYRGYRLLSSPVSTSSTSHLYEINYLQNSCYLTGTTGTAGGFDGGVNPTLYLFREDLVPSNATFTSGNYRGINNIVGYLPSYYMDVDNGPYSIPYGNGYMFFFRGDRSVASYTAETSTTYIPTGTTLTASGALNQGAIPVNSWYTPNGTGLIYTTISGSTAVEGFNLVGNPYPSSINWDLYSTTSSAAGIYAPNVEPFLYILNSKSGNYNVYQAGNGGVGTVAATGSNVIPSGQGFFVVATANNTSLTFNEAAKTNLQATAAQGNLFLGAPPVAAVSQYMRIMLVQDSLSFDGTIINFNSGASQNYVKGEDAIYRKGNGLVGLSSVSADNIQLAINGEPLPNLISSTIPLKLLVSADGPYSLNLSTVKSIPALYEIWLKDAMNKDSLDIKDNPTYAFSATASDSTTYANRFSLVIRQNPALMIHLLSFNATKITGGDQVVWTTENEQNYTYFTVERSTNGGTSYNALGGYVSSGISSYSYLDNAPILGANTYRLKIVDLNGTITYSNAVTIMYANTNNQIAINGMMVYPNPTAGSLNVSIANQTTSGTVTTTTAATGATYNIEIVNNLGAVIKTAQSGSPLWQTDVSSLIPGTYFIRVVNASNNTVVGKSAFVKL